MCPSVEFCTHCRIMPFPPTFLYPNILVTHSMMSRWIVCYLVYASSLTLAAAFSSELPLGRGVDLAQVVPSDDLGLSLRGSVNILREESLNSCVYAMGGPTTTQSELLSESATDFASQFSYDAGIDATYGAFKLAASRSVRQDSDLHKDRSFAKKTVSIQMRSLNIRHECLKDPSYMNPQFVEDLFNLPR